MENYYKAGSWWVHCPVCQFKYRGEVMKRRWDGQWVCPPDWEPRHPQELIRGVKEKQTVPIPLKENVTMETPTPTYTPVSGL